MEKQGNGAERAVNGAYKRNPDDTSQPFTGWEAAETGTQSLVLDLEFAVSFDRYVIKHDNSTSGLGKERNTDSFKVQVLEEGVTLDEAEESDWITVDEVTGNTEDVTDKKLDEAVRTRYVRLLIEKPTAEDGDNTARISQFELYCDDNYAESLATPEKGASVTASSNPYNNMNNIIDDTWYKDKNGVNDYSGWTSVNGKMPQWAQIDLGEDRTFDEWGMVHSGNEMLVQDLYASGNDTADHHSSFPTGYRRFNPRDFKVSYKAEGDEEWTVLEDVKGNTSGLTAQKLDAPVTARYIRIDYTTGEQYKPGTTTLDPNQRARLAKFYLFDNEQSSFYTMPVEESPSADTAAEPAVMSLASAQDDFLEQLDIAKAEVNTDMTLGESEAVRFGISDGKVLLPFVTLDGMGETAARSFVEEYEKKPYETIEEIMKRAKINKSSIEALKARGVLKGLPETDQLSFF